MSFTEEQTAALSAKLESTAVKSRKQGNSQVQYIEGWHAIAEANRIFGYGAWDRETVDMRCVSERERKIGQQQKDGWGVTYTAKVRITIRSQSDLVSREGVGAGHGIDTDLGQAHESAIKEAETDAMKRALMTFGNPFGLALYDKDRTNVEGAPASQGRQQQPKVEPRYAIQANSAQEFVQRLRALINDAPSTQALQQIKDANARGLSQLQGDDKPTWENVMQAFSKATTNIMDKEAA